jgi:hypothetical protein
LEPGAAHSNRPEGFGHTDSASAATWISNCGTDMPCYSIALQPSNGLRDCVRAMPVCQRLAHDSLTCHKNRSLSDSSNLCDSRDAFVRCPKPHFYHYIVLVSDIMSSCIRQTPTFFWPGQARCHPQVPENRNERMSHLRHPGVICRGSIWRVQKSRSAAPSRPSLLRLRRQTADWGALADLRKRQRMLTAPPCGRKMKK